MKIANIGREFLNSHSHRITVTENQGFTLYLEDTFFKKPQGRSNWTPPLPYPPQTFYG